MILSQPHQRTRIRRLHHPHSQVRLKGTLKYWATTTTMVKLCHIKLWSRSYQCKPHLSGWVPLLVTIQLPCVSTSPIMPVLACGSGVSDLNPQGVHLYLLGAGLTPIPRTGELGPLSMDHCQGSDATNQPWPWIKGGILGQEDKHYDMWINCI